ncbi:MAG: YIP1 family protein [Pseudomonadota bacterium]
MSDTLPARIVEGFAAPRASARRILAEGLTLDTAVLMVVFGYVVTAIAQLILAPDVQRPEGNAFAYHIMNLLLQIGVFFLIAGMAFGLGKISGGTGTLPQAQALIGWHSLVTSMLAPVSVYAAAEIVGSVARMSETDPDAQIDPAALEISGGSIFLALLVAGVWFWLLANYVAELHGFKNVWGVLGVICGLPVAIGMFLLWTTAVVATVGGAG